MMYYKNFLASQLSGLEMDDDLILRTTSINRQTDGSATASGSIRCGRKYVALLRAAVYALLDGKLGRTIEETREEWLERIARGRRREESNLAILRAALG